MSDEGTTQGDNCASGFYSIGIFPIISKLSMAGIENLRQSWFADDAAGAGKLIGIKQWWDMLLNIGPKFGILS